jgi:uncharacterized phage protein gp47/JayE
MPWQTPTLRDVRSLVRDAIRGALPGADAIVPNSVLRVLSDAMGALCHLVLQYVDWLAQQLLPDTAETEWLDRHGVIWLVNADGTTGRKLATLAQGTADFVTSTGSVSVPTGTQLSYSTGVGYQTTADIVTDPTGLPTAAPIVALDTGSIGNLDPGAPLALQTPLSGSIDSITVDTLDGGTDDETDDELRARILKRIREPPMGGDATDYEQWALAVPGVTRAWSYPLEMGIGTVTVRFMMDDLRASNDGFPTPNDVDAVQAYLDTVRPVAVKDFFVEAPIPYPVNVRIRWLNIDTVATHAAIEQSLIDSFLVLSKPGQTWYRAWTDAAIMTAANVIAYDLDPSTADAVMASSGYMPTLGDITYG